MYVLLWERCGPRACEVTILSVDIMLSHSDVVSASMFAERSNRRSTSCSDISVPTNQAEKSQRLRDCSFAQIATDCNVTYPTPFEISRTTSMSAQTSSPRYRAPPFFGPLDWVAPRLRVEPFYWAVRRYLFHRTKEPYPLIHKSWRAALPFFRAVRWVVPLCSKKIGSLQMRI